MTMSKRWMALFVALLIAIPAGMALAGDSDLTPADLQQAPQTIEEGVLFYIPGPCCSSVADCPKVSGYSVACGGEICDGKHTCMYRASASTLDLDAAGELPPPCPNALR